MHSLSDERCEYLIKDRLSFMRFLGLALANPVPDANTIWTFREALTRVTIDGEPAVAALFKRFDASVKAWLTQHDRVEADDQGRPHPEDWKS